MKQRNIAVVTGASSGLGKEFVRQINHYQTIAEIWCLARHPQKLQAVAEEFGTKIRIFPVDLSVTDQIKSFQAKLKEEPICIKILVNSAGFAKFCSYDDLDLDRSLNMIDVNCKGVVAMGLICIPYMSKGSRILNIASLASFQPLPYLNLYSATKAFVKNYSRALNVELKDRKIYVTTVCPGWIQTALYDRANIGSTKTLRHFTGMTSPDQVASKALRDAARHRDISVYGSLTKLMHLLGKLLPHRALMKFWLFYQGLSPKK